MVSRRTFIGVIGALSLSGCTDVIPSTPVRQQADNPWGKMGVTVSVEEDDPTEFDSTQVTRDALDYWEKHSAQYTSYEISYELITSDESSDIDVRFVNELPSCGDTVYDHNAAGCADLVTDTPPRVTNVRILISPYGELVLETLKHEFGHTLGLEHGDEPTELMKATIEVIPDQDQRLKLYNTYIAGLQQYSSAISIFNDGTRAYNNESYSQAEAYYDSASGLFEDCQDEFEEAKSISIALELTDPIRICDEAISKAALLVQASASLADSSQSASLLGSGAERSYRTAVTYFARADEIDIDDGTRLADSLEIPLGPPEDLIINYA